MKKESLLKYFLMALLSIGQGSLIAQTIHYSTLHGDCAEVESNPCDAGHQRCCHPHHDRYQTDQLAEEQFQDAGWPGRRDDELSDQLMR